MVWVMFVIMNNYVPNGTGSASFQRDFKTKNECLHVLSNIKSRFNDVSGFCQEVNK